MQAKLRKLVPQERIRTPDPIITNDVLYQLSYCGAAIENAAGASDGDAVYANSGGFGNMQVGNAVGAEARAW